MYDLSELYSILLLNILDENDCEYGFPVLICIQCKLIMQGALVSLGDGMHLLAF